MMAIRIKRKVKGSYTLGVRHKKKERIADFIAALSTLMKDEPSKVRQQAIRNLCTSERNFWGYVRKGSKRLVKPATYMRYMSDYRIEIEKLNLVNDNAISQIERLKSRFSEVDFSTIERVGLRCDISLNLLDAKMPELRHNVDFLLLHIPNSGFSDVKAAIGKFKKQSMEITAHLAMRPRDEVIKDVNGDSTVMVANKNRARIGVSLPLVNALLNRLVLSDHWLDLAVWVSLVSGRRMVEVLRSGEFVKIDDSNVLFSGQLKKKNLEVEEVYSIPLLVPSDVFLAGVAKLRAKVAKLSFLGRKFNDLSNYEINSAVAGRLNVTAKRHLDDKDLTFKSCRAIYVNIVLSYPRDNTHLSDDAYKADILGHGRDDLTTGHSYSSVFVVDSVPDRVFDIVFSVDGIPVDRDGQKSLDELITYDDAIKANGKKSLANIHKHVKTELLNPDYVVSYTTLGRSKANGGCGAERAAIKAYLKLVGLPYVSRGRKLKEV